MRKILLTVATAAMIATAPMAAQAASGAVTGAAGGAITGALVGGPIGAAVGVVVGALLGTAVDGGTVFVGARVPASVALYPNADGTASAWFDGHRVVVDPRTRVIISSSS